MITFDEFRRVDLRTARVVSARPHPNADRLLVVTADLGDLGQRQLVAGIKPWYSPEDLVGKTVVVVANLEPANLRGEESQGMLLAVLDGDSCRIVSTDGETRPGLAVT